MERAAFLARFRRAAERARDFARECVIEPLPDPIRVRLVVYPYFDDSLRAAERLYPSDVPLRELLTIEDAAARIYRDGAIPDWIDLSVMDERDGFTEVEVTCSGRVVADDRRLSYEDAEGRTPFHVVGPAVAPDVEIVEGTPPPKHSLHWYVELDDRGELGRLAPLTDRVQTLGLRGPSFDDAVLGAMGPFACLRTLRLDGTSVRGPGLATLCPAGALAHVTLAAPPGVALSLGALLALESLERLMVTQREGSCDGLEAIAGLRALSWLELHVATLDDVAMLAELRALRFLNLADTRIASLAPLALLDDIESLTLARTSVADDALADLRGYTRLRDLDLQDTRVGDRGIASLRALPALRWLRLRGTAVTAAAVPVLCEFPRLKILDLRGTAIREADVAALRVARPKLRILLDATPTP